MYTEYLKTKLELLASSKDTLTSIDAGSALSWVTDHIDPMEREHERLIKILEGLRIDTDEETLATLELIGTCKHDGYRSQRESIAESIRDAVEEVAAL